MSENPPLTGRTRCGPRWPVSPNRQSMVAKTNISAPPSGVACRCVVRRPMTDESFVLASSLPTSLEPRFDTLFAFYLVRPQVIWLFSRLLFYRVVASFRRYVADDGRVVRSQFSLANPLIFYRQTGTEFHWLFTIFQFTYFFYVVFGLKDLVMNELLISTWPSETSFLYILFYCVHCNFLFSKVNTK